MSLNKAGEYWWSAVLEGEEPIDIDQINKERSMATVGEEEHAVLDRLTFDYHQKLQGKPQSHELVRASPAAGLGWLAMSAGWCGLGGVGVDGTGRAGVDGAEWHVPCVLTPAAPAGQLVTPQTGHTVHTWSELRWQGRNLHPQLCRSRSGGQAQPGRRTRVRGPPESL